MEFELKKASSEVRINILKMINKGGSSHIASAFSCVDILVSLYGKILNTTPSNINDIDRDYFVMSKGHAGAAVYATLARFGFFDDEDLSGHYQNGTRLSGHVSHVGINGVEFSTGSLGHGLPYACGLALSARIDNRNSRVYCLNSDGEMGEGSNWEAILFASHHGLDNLCLLIDRNKLQSIKGTEDTLKLEPLWQKFEAFGWEVKLVNGHCHSDIEEACLAAPNGCPRVVICDTIKGKGVSFMENTVEWHYKTPKDNLFEAALNELELSSCE